MVRWSCAALMGIVALTGCHSGPVPHPVGKAACSASDGAGPDCAPGGARETGVCDHDACGPHCCLSCPHYHSFWDRLITSMSATHRAEKSFGRYVEKCGHRPSHDFYAGYVDGFVDVAQGGSGVVPPIPPERYWGAASRTPRGHQRAHEWFAGYSAGADAALSSCCAAYNRVPHRGVSQAVQVPPPGPHQPLY